MLGYFAMFGAMFLHHPAAAVRPRLLAAGGRHPVLPFALTMAVFATCRAKLVERVGTKVVVDRGLGLVAAGLLWAAQSGQLASSYGDYCRQ